MAKKKKGNGRHFWQVAVARLVMGGLAGLESYVKGGIITVGKKKAGRIDRLFVCPSGLPVYFFTEKSNTDHP